MKKVFLSVGSILFITGCGGSGTSDNNVAIPLTSVSAYEAAAPFVEVFENGNPQNLAASEAPSRASFSGIIQYSEGQNDQLVVGALNMDADFDNGTVSGNADTFSRVALTNFIESPSATAREFRVLEEFSGTLAISNGSIAKNAGIALSADLNGTLTDEDGSKILYDLSLQGEVAQLPSDDSLYTYGSVDGSVTTSSDFQELDSDFDTGGSFVAAEN